MGVHKRGEPAPRGGGGSGVASCRQRPGIATLFAVVQPGAGASSINGFVSVSCRHMRRLALPLIAVLACVVPAAAAAAPKGQRDVLVVSNNWAGTADLIDPHTFKRLARVNVIPDKAKRIAAIEKDPSAKAVFDFVRENIGEGHNQYVDDGFTSKNGRY